MNFAKVSASELGFEEKFEQKCCAETKSFHAHKNRFS